MELAKGRIFKWDYVIFATKIWTHKLFISSSKRFMYLLWLAKIMKGSCIFCCSSYVSFHPTNHLKKNLLRDIKAKYIICIRHFLKNIQNIHWTCLNAQLNYKLWIYFLFLHVRIKTVQKISQFSCFHYTSACVHAVLKPIR